ncbi:hypothetical protein [Mesobacillus foraminis]|uniref:hypothetical protein n=1 Tax=Mesobacillus foraminis TaxID=279826 RepID=UPI002035AC06|nr:hypothetical protein [Mesobacillus foraminis]
MSLWLNSLLYTNLVLAILVFFYLHRRRKLIGFHLGMNIAMVVGGGLAILTGVILITLYPLHFMEVTVLSVLTGILAGSIFGALFDYQTLLTGYINGLMMGIMAPMVGAAASESMVFIVVLQLFIFIIFIILMVFAKSTT